MRAQTPSFVVSIKLHLPKQIENHLEKSFRISNSAYNEALSFGLKRFEALKRNSHYQELLDARRLALKGIAKLKKAEKTAKGLTQQVKCYNKILFELRKAYGLTEFGLSARLSQQRQKPGSPYRQISAGEIQVIAGQAMKTLEKVLFYQIKSHKVRFRSKFDLDVSYRNRVNTEATRLVKSDRKGFAYRLYIHKASTFVDIPVKAFNKYQQMSLMRSEKIKYVQIIRKTIRGKKVYTLQIVCQGFPPSKVTKGEGVVGIDPGISTVAYASPNEVALVDLVPKNITRKEKLMKQLDRKIERSRRVNNPECYEANGKIKKGTQFKRPSKRQVRLHNRRRQVYRSLSEERKKLQGRLVNRIVSQARIIKIEDLNVKGLQRRSQEIRINPKTNRPYSKKRYGKAVFRAAPSGFRVALETRASQLGIDVEVISPKDVKPSQYNHITQTFEKKSLSIRVYDLSDKYPDVQRDLYSAFLIGHIENGHYQQAQLEQDFPDFYQQMKDFLQQPIETERLAWYLN
jgi:transposase